MLSCDSNGGSDIYIGVDPFTPLVFGEFLLMKTVRCHLLFIHDSEWVLILCLGKDGLPNKGHELKWIIACACGVPIGIVLHLFRDYMVTLTSHH